MALRRPEPSPYQLRPAEFSDMDEVARIEQESFVVPWKKDFFVSELAEPHRYARVLARDDGQPPRIGGYLFAVSLYDEFHINKIATDLRLRHRGYGRWLLEDALARARTIDAAAITLEVRVSNAPARKFYDSYGFREAYRRRAYYQDGEDALVLIFPLRSEGPPGRV